MRFALAIIAIAWGAPALACKMTPMAFYQTNVNAALAFLMKDLSPARQQELSLKQVRFEKGATVIETTDSKGKCEAIGYQIVRSANCMTNVRKRPETYSCQ